MAPIAEDEQPDNTPQSNKKDSVGEFLDDEEEAKVKADLQEIEDVKAEYAGRENDQDLLSSVNKIGQKFRAKKLAEKEKAKKLADAKAEKEAKAQAEAQVEATG